MAGSRQRTGVSPAGRVYAGVQLLLGVYWSLDARFGSGTRVTLLLGVAWLLLGLTLLALGPTSCDDEGVRPTMQLRRVPWHRVRLAHRSTSRPGSLALQIGDGRRPTWVRDPVQAVAQRYTAATGRAVATYGVRSG